MLCILYLFWSLIGSFFCVESKFFFSWRGLHVAEPMALGFYHHKGEMLNAQEHCVRLTLCIVIPWGLSLSLVHGIHVHGYFVWLARATWCWGERLQDLDWWRHWKDGVCVVGMRGRQQGAGQSVCSCSIRGLDARARTQRMRGWREREQESGERADTSRTILRNMWGCWEKLDMRSLWPRQEGLGE